MMHAIIITAASPAMRLHSKFPTIRNLITYCLQSAGKVQVFFETGQPQLTLGLIVGYW